MRTKNRKSRLILFHPRTGHEKNYRFFWIPYSILSLAAALTTRCEIKIIDNNLLGIEDFQACLADSLQDCVCVGISAMIGHQIKEGLAFAKIVKATDPEIPIIWGGAMPSSIPEVALQNDVVDIVIRGQGEVTFQEIVSRIQSGRFLMDVPGISLKQNRQVKHVGKAPFCDKNAFPCYPFELIDPLKYVRDDPQVNSRTINYISSQGCPYKCGFCCEVAIYGSRWTALSAERMIQEIMLLINRYDINGVKFYDADFAIDVNRVRKFSQQLLEKRIRISWGASVSVPDILRMGNETLESMARSGCRRLLIGAESGVQEELDLLRKQFRVEDILRVARILKDYDITPSFTLMVGLPGSNTESVMITLDFGYRLKSVHPKAEIKAHFFTPYPKTPLWPLALAHGFRPPSTLLEWSEYDYYEIQVPWINREHEKTVREFNLENCPYVQE